MPRKQNTRSAQGAGTIRQRPDGRWEARYTLGRDPGTGKQVQKSIYGSTQKEVRQRLQQIMTSVDSGEYIQPSKMTVGEWLEIWQSEYLNGVKPATLDKYACQIRLHIAPRIGSVKLSALTAPMIQKLYNEEHAGGYSPKSITNMHGVLHKALSQAVRLGYIRSNPAEVCDLPRVERKEMQPLEGDSVGAFLRAVSGHPFENLYVITLFTGMREAEALGLTWSCVDFGKHSITVEKQLQRERKRGGAYVFAPLKNDKTRSITLAPSVMEIFKRQRRAQQEARLQAGKLWNNSRDLVFTNAFGENLATVTVYKSFKMIAASIGMPGMRFHDLRHTFAMLSLQSGDDVKTVSENLGHATVAFTLDVYGHVSETMKQASAARMEAFIQSIK